MSQKFYRATLILQEVEPYTDDHGYARERCTETASINVTGDTPADAMSQIHGHAGSLLVWHEDQADEPPPQIVLDLNADPELAQDIRQILTDIRAANVRVADPGGRAAEANQDSDSEDVVRCTARASDGTLCGFPASHDKLIGDDGQTYDHGRFALNRWNDTHDAYGTPITPPVELDDDQRHRAAGFGRGLYLPVTDEADDLDQASEIELGGLTRARQPRSGHAAA